MNALLPRPLAALLLAALLPAGPALAHSDVDLVKAPHEGFRPQAVVDADGMLHVVQSKFSQRGDLFYVRRGPGASEFSDPIAVNTTPDIVASFDMAVGANGRVHVLMRTNPKYSKLAMPAEAEIGFFDLKYMLYARLADDGQHFEQERNLAGPTIGFEGMGTILADENDGVLAFWHGQLTPEFDEPSRQIFRVRSTDGGRTFSEPAAVETDAVGACQCCSLAGDLGAGDDIFLTFRNSTEVRGTWRKDSYLLTSTDGGATFRATLLEPWELAGCPGSRGALASVASGPWVAWRTRADLHFARVASEGASRELAAVASTSGVSARFPVVIGNEKGEVLCAWVETGGPQARGGGDLAWQVFDANGRALSEKRILCGAVSQGWGAPTAAARPDGSFVILYDGPADPAASTGR